MFHDREAKQHAAPINFAEMIPDFGSIYAAKCNCNASKVAVIVNKVSETTCRNYKLILSDCI